MRYTIIGASYMQRQFGLAYGPGDRVADAIGIQPNGYTRKHPTVPNAYYVKRGSSFVQDERKTHSGGRTCIKT